MNADQLIQQFKTVGRTSDVARNIRANEGEIPSATRERLLSSINEAPCQHYLLPSSVLPAFNSILLFKNGPVCSKSYRRRPSAPIFESCLPWGIKEQMVGLIRSNRNAAMSRTTDSGVEINFGK